MNNLKYKIVKISDKSEELLRYISDIFFHCKLMEENHLDLSKRQNRKILRYCIIKYYLECLLMDSKTVFIIDSPNFINNDIDVNKDTLYREFQRVSKIIKKSFPCNFITDQTEFSVMKKSELENYVFLYCRDKWDFDYIKMKEFLLKNQIPEKILENVFF